MSCRRMNGKNIVYFGKTGEKNLLRIGKSQYTAKKDEIEYHYSGWEDYTEFTFNDDGTMTYGENTDKYEWLDENLNGIVILDESADENGDTECTYKFFVYTNEKEDNYASGTDGVVESLKQRLSVIRGELWYQTDFGLPLLEKYRSKYTMDAEILNIIENHSGVRTIDEYSSTLGSDHTYVFTCKITSVYGEEFEISENYQI